MTDTLHSEQIPLESDAEIGRRLVRLLASRRSVPAMLLGDPGPDEDELRNLLTIAARAPDHGMLTPWRFIVIDGELRAQARAELVRAFRASEPEATPEQQAKFAAKLALIFNAPLIVIVVSKVDARARIPAWEQHLSCGAVCMNLLNAAHASGFAAVWLTGWMANSDAAHRVLGVDLAERVAGVICVGAVRQTVADRTRPDLSRIAKRWLPPGPDSSER
jgi:nitroreductase